MAVTKIIQAPPFSLGQNIGPQDNTFVVLNFRDTDGNLITLAENEILFVNIDVSNVSSETISVGSVTNLGNNQTRFSNVLRGYNPQYKNQTPTGTGKNHSTGASCILADSPQIFDGFVQPEEDTIFTGSNSFILPLSVATPQATNHATNQGFVTNLVKAGGSIATNNIPGLVGVADVPTFIEGGQYIQPEGEYINLPNQENILHIKKIRNNPNDTNLYILDNAGFIYKVITLNGKQTSTTKLNTTARTDLYKILSVESDNSIYLISTNNNIVVRYTGGDTFTNVTVTGTAIPSGRVLSTTEVLTIDSLTTTSINAFISFEGSQGVYRLVIANATKLSATSSILPNTTTLYPLNLDYSEDNSLYFNSLAGNSFVSANLTDTFYRLLLSDNSIQNIVIPAISNYSSFAVWNDPDNVNNDKIVFNYIDGGNAVDIYEITSKSPLSFSAVSTQMSQPYYSRANPSGTTLTSTNTLLGATILLNYFYSMEVPTQAGQVGFELLSNNLLQDTPASTTAKVIQPLSAGATPFTIIGRIQNYFNVGSNTETKITTEQTLTITPPATAGIRTDLIVLDSNNTLQARLGVIAGAIGTPQTGDRVLGKCQTTFQGEGLDYLVNYDNREVKEAVNNIGIVNSQTITAGNQITLKNYTRSDANKIIEIEIPFSATLFYQNGDKVIDILLNGTVISTLTITNNAYSASGAYSLQGKLKLKLDNQRIYSIIESSGSATGGGGIIVSPPSIKSSTSTINIADSNQLNIRNNNTPNTQDITIGVVSIISIS